MIVVDANFYVDVVVVENNIVLGCGLRVWAHRFYFVVSSPAACGLRLALPLMRTIVPRQHVT